MSPLAAARLTSRQSVVASATPVAQRHRQGHRAGLTSPECRGSSGVRVVEFRIAVRGRGTGKRKIARSRWQVGP